MTLREELQQLKPFEARAIIESLRKGSVPMEYIPAFTVGRHNWLKFIEDDLEHYIAEGGAKVRFINGDYGDGKTHFMSLVRHIARQKGFAVSFVVLSHEVQIHKFELIYQTMVRNLTAADTTGIRALVEKWLESLTATLATPDEAANQEALGSLTETLRQLPEMDLNFANALIGLASNRFEPLAEGETRESRREQAEILWQWLEGAKISKRDLKPFQIFEVLDKTNSKRLLRALIAFLRFRQHRGLILLLDELETIIAQSAAVRSAGYENVRLLIDNTEQAGYLHIFMSIIPDVLLSEKGFKSYDALWSRVRSIGEGSRLNYRSVLVDLHKTPLQANELVELGLCLSRIHEISYRWDSQGQLSQELLQKILDTQKRMGLLSEVRLFIKQIIRLLDMAEQGSPLDENLDLKEQILTSQKELQQEKLEQLQPTWDS